MQKRIVDKPWIWSQDRVLAQSLRRKVWDEDRSACEWWLEVRTEDIGGGSIRMGQLVFRGSADGELTMRLEEIEDNAL